MIGWILSALTLATLLALLLPRKLGLVGWVGLFIVSLLPLFQDLSVAEYFRGVLGDLSLTTQLLLYGALLGRLSGRPLYNCCERWSQLSLIAVVGALFYPFALGWTYFDPYGWGFGNYYMLATVAALALIVWWRCWYFSSLILSLALLGWSFDLLESRNLWDYLLDPAIFIYAVIGCLFKAMKVGWQSVRTGH